MQRYEVPLIWVLVYGCGYDRVDRVNDMSPLCLGMGNDEIESYKDGGGGSEIAYDRGIGCT
jgi:hypothetical protein